MENIKVGAYYLRDYAVSQVDGTDDDVLREWLGTNVGTFNYSNNGKEIKFEYDSGFKF